MQHPGAGNGNHFDGRRNGGYTAPHGRREDLPRVPDGPGPGSFPRRPNVNPQLAAETVSMQPVQQAGQVYHGTRVPVDSTQTAHKPPVADLDWIELEDGKSKVEKQHGPGEKVFGYAVGTVCGTFGVSVLGLFLLKTFFIIKDWLNL